MTMRIRDVVKNLIGKTGYVIEKCPGPGVYNQDGLRSLHNHDFIRDPDFRRAYDRGVLAAGEDYRWEWRVHIGLWAAKSASRLAGDFVECGVNRGFMSSAVMEYLNWDSLGKTFYLLDTFRGLDERFVSGQEIAAGALQKNRQFLASGFYVSELEPVKSNFSQWKNVRIIQGSVPDTLGLVDARKIAYLHLDMNCSRPELAAIGILWDRIVPGGIILLDDFAFHESGYSISDMNRFLEGKNGAIATLPTGQGLVLKTESGESGVSK